ncbi:MAG: hypothetical protein UR30_C0011G0002 [Candidatus Peregrinibacteria bacterium GW2011_GWC2_33_13]|nr:MAG: hypothetical protein UR30_C0011G0002 [Candidatus Peregrinibacteria bacterium GW2011_GWC2_33_13]
MNPTDYLQDELILSPQETKEDVSREVDAGVHEDLGKVSENIGGKVIEGVGEECDIGRDGGEKKKRKGKKVELNGKVIIQEPFQDELFLECVKQAWGIRGDIKKEDLKKITASWVNKNKIKLSHLEEGKEYASYLWSSFIIKFGETPKLGSLQIRLRVAEIYGFADLVTSIREEIKIAQVEKQEREKRQVQEEPFPIEKTSMGDKGRYQKRGFKENYS